jgi:iron complex outermembrane receptor protein
LGRPGRYLAQHLRKSDVEEVRMNTGRKHDGYFRAVLCAAGGISLLWGVPADKPATGPQSLKTMSLEDLSKIEVITVSKEATGAFQMPAAISVLTREDIARSGATNIPDLLRLVPGVEVAQISSDKWAIGIRGFEGYLSKAVLVMIDGRSVYTPLFAGVYWEMQDTMIEDIDRIEVIRGPGGTIWGANAVNGVINIITRNAQETRGSLVAAEGGNVEQGAVSARYGAGDDHLAYRVWTKGFTRGPQFHQDSQNYDDWRRGQAGFRLDWTPTGADSVTVSGGAYSMEAGSLLGISTYSPPALQNVQGNGDFSGQNLVAAWRRTFQSGSDIQLRAYFDRADRADLNYREVRDTVDFDFIHHLRRGPNDFIWGLGVHISPSHFIQTVPTVIFTPAHETYSVYSGFVQDTISLIPNRLAAIMGTKLEHNSYSGFEVQPSGRLAWTPSQQQTIWAAVTRAVRTPSRIEEGFQYTALAAPSVPLYLRLIGDGQFESEEFAGYELGYRTYIKRGGFISINGFYNRYDNLLSVENRPPAPEASPAPLHYILPLYFRNGIAAQTKGFEVAGLWAAKSWWRWKGSYSYLHLNAERYPTSDDASTVKQLQGDTPQHKVVVQSLLALPRGFDLDLTYRYVSAIPDQGVDAYATGDARLAKRITRSIDLSAVGQNLFQPHHPEYGLVGIRRSAFLRLEWSAGR